MPDRLSAIEARAAAATPGPWRATHDPLGFHVEDGRRPLGRIAVDIGGDKGQPNRADAEFIAAARADVDLMAKVLRDVQALRRRILNTVDPAQDGFTVRTEILRLLDAALAPLFTEVGE